MVRPAVVQSRSAVPSSPAPTERNVAGRPTRPRRLYHLAPGRGRPSLFARPPAATSVIPASSGTCRSLALKCPASGGAGRRCPVLLLRPSSSGIASRFQTSSRARRRTPGRTGKRGRGLPTAPAERGVVRDERLSHDDQRRDEGLQVGRRDYRTVRPPGRGDGELTPKDAVADDRRPERRGTPSPSSTQYYVYDADERPNDSAPLSKVLPVQAIELGTR